MTRVTEHLQTHGVLFEPIAHQQGYTSIDEASALGIGASEVLKLRPIAGEEGLAVALYLYQAAYTAESVTAQIKEPQDRIKAVKPALEALGAQIVVGGYPFGEYDLLVISRHLMTPPRPASRWRLPTAVPSGRPRPSGC